MRLGFLLGTFDPMHIGHIATISTVLYENKCDKVYVVPTVHNPTKDMPVADFEQRCNWIDKLIEPFGDAAECCRVEEELKEPYYSCFTLEKISERYGDDNELFIICGADIINTIESWRNYETMIKDRFKYIVFTRTDIDITNRDIKFEICTTEVPDVSSTKLRNMMQHDFTPYPFISDGEVAKETLELYKNNYTI